MFFFSADDANRRPDESQLLSAVPRFRTPPQDPRNSAPLPTVHEDPTHARSAAITLLKSRSCQVEYYSLPINIPSDEQWLAAHQTTTTTTSVAAVNSTRAQSTWENATKSSRKHLSKPGSCWRRRSSLWPRLAHSGIMSLAIQDCFDHLWCDLVLNLRSNVVQFLFCS